MMTTILVSLIVISWLALTLAGESFPFFGEQADSLEAIAIPVRDLSTTPVDSHAAYRSR